MTPPKKTNINCVQRTNIQNLKAIHNWRVYFSNGVAIVFKERIYKIWKQFTTAAYHQEAGGGLCSKNEYTKSESNSQPEPTTATIRANCVQRTNIQNLKAIHNFPAHLRCSCLLCSKNEYTKSESNSQRASRRGSPSSHCVQRTNIQNLKAIHNQTASAFKPLTIVFKERIYKIWKQFTTSGHRRTPSRPLCSKNEYTKSESNSQQVGDYLVDIVIVFKERIYKIWKQFTTHLPFAIQMSRLCSKNEYTKSESNSQHIVRKIASGRHCVQRTNIQNLKAIHNTAW